MVCAILKQYWWLFAFWKITPLIVGSSAFAVVGRESDAVLVSNINPSQVHCITFYSDIAGNKDYFIAPVEKIAYSALQVLRPVLALVFFLLLVILEKFYYFALLWCFVKKKILNFKNKCNNKNILSDDFGVFMWGWAPYCKESIKHTISGSELTWPDEKWVVGIRILKISIQSAVLHEIL